jgi:hypothetical protein
MSIKDLASQKKCENFILLGVSENIRTGGMSKNRGTHQFNKSDSYTSSIASPTQI